MERGFSQRFSRYRRRPGRTSAWAAAARHRHHLFRTEKLRLSIASEPRTYLTDFIPNDYFGQNHQFIVVGLRSLIQKAQEAGLSIPTERTIVITGLREGEIWVNMTRVKGVDGTDPRSLSAGEIEARRQIDDIHKYLSLYVPGFEKCYFTKTAPFLGIRETRRIVGQYVMARDDVLSCRKFEDAIAVASYPIDLHRPKDDGCTLEWCGDCTTFRTVRSYRRRWTICW